VGAGRATLALLAVTSLVLSACGGSTTEQPAAPAPAAPAPAPVVEEPPSGNLVFGNWQWLEQGRGDDLWAAVSAYTEANTNATMEQAATPFGEYADTLNTQLGGGVGPDIFVILDSQWVVLQDAGLLAPLDDVVAGAALNASNDSLRADGELFGVTWEQVTYALLANKNLLAEAGIAALPTTVDELIAAGLQVQERTAADGFAVRHRIAELAGWRADFPNWTYGFGGSWSSNGALTLATDANVAAVEAFKKVYDSGIMPVGDDASTFRNKFRENSLAFIIDNSGAALSFTSGGQLTGADMISGPLPFPEGAGAHQKLILAVNANSPNVELAKDFIRWFVSTEGQTLIRPPLGASTLATDVPLPADFLAANPWAETYVQLGSRSRGLLIEGFEIVSVDYYQTIMEAIERVITTNQDARAALQQAQQQLG
jgi:multiple sugar transport system substrate-binding protein